MTDPLFSTTLSGPDETAAFSRRIAPALQAGDCLLLEGPVGAGKSHFSRTLIQSLQNEPEDVPSPTFTLVQTYDTSAGEVWHCDLYRLTSPNEIFELGLDDAFAEAICLIEWPDRLGENGPRQALTLRFSIDAQPHVRHVQIHGDKQRWARVAGVLRD